MSTAPKTILFLGATGASGLAVLRRSLAAAKLSDAEQKDPALRIEQGNAHEVEDLTRCLVLPSSSPSSPPMLVGLVVFCIGGALDLWRRTIPDPKVCETAIARLLEALDLCRAQQSAEHKQYPRIVAFSTTGVTEMGGDLPLAVAPLYHFFLGVPHVDKRAMEKMLFASTERWTILRPSFLTDGPETSRPTRVGVEDPLAGTVDSREIGYSISREDVGRWVFGNIVEEHDDRYLRKAASITC
ncbi:hypothetical protein B0T24DRAFT_600173 [Lasiosphaeria ovina]|uniref:NAD(P)-binding domain-containing protein n=1 Tax=Lasiosphaeria ovina TaxID=92902 RepID=A0AAE0MY18_9PEZI|nr:hypothetical protein B0T24DRAFT_600173 [Lasiosphaeria ovina]